MISFIHNFLLKRSDPKDFTFEGNKYWAKVVGIKEYYFEVIFKLSFNTQPYKFRCILLEQNKNNIIDKLTMGQKKYISDNFLNKIIRIKCHDMLFDLRNVIIPIEILSDRSVSPVVDYQKNTKKIVFYRREGGSNTSSDSEFEHLDIVN